MVDLKAKLRSNKPSIGSWITFGDTGIAEIMAGSGFDWLAIDMEHSAITIESAQRLIQVVELSGVVPLVRVGDNDPVLIKRVMDAGAHGVIVPMVNSAQDAMRAVEAVKYPPVGTRGVGLARAHGYGQDFDGYRRWVNKGSIVIAQIEHKEGIDALDDIIGVEGIDGTIVGPYDLSGSYGHPGDFERREVKNALKRYESVNKKARKPMGYHVVQPDVQAAKRFIRSGYTFIAVGVDMLYIGNKCRETLKGLRG